MSKSSNAAVSFHGESGRIAALDVLRLIAALWVLGWHWFFEGYIRHFVDFSIPWLVPIAQYGFLGVEVFFVISGFVIAMSMEGRGVREFVLARLVRLYPAYWMCAAITVAAVAAWGGGPFACDFRCIAANASMLNGFFDNHFIDPSYWSLTVELQFYFTVALLMAVNGRRYLFETMIVWMLLSAARFVPMHGVEVAYYWSKAAWAPFFGGGVALFLIWKHGLRLRYGLGLLLAWLLCCGYVAGDVSDYAQLVTTGPPFSVARGVGVFSAFMLLLLFIALRRVQIPSSSFSKTCGGASYTLYLLHQVVGIVLLGRLREWLPDTAAGMVAFSVFALILLLSILVWRFAELPVQRWLRRRLASFARPVGNLSAVAGN